MVFSLLVTSVAAMVVAASNESLTLPPFVISKDETKTSETWITLSESSLVCKRHDDISIPHASQWHTINDLRHLVIKGEFGRHHRVFGYVPSWSQVKADAWLPCAYLLFIMLRQPEWVLQLGTCLFFFVLSIINCSLSLSCRQNVRRSIP
jgi:hypothetical protein